jgi:hypothetical protein
MSLLLDKHADEIRTMWQSRALAASSGKLRKVIVIALAKEYPGAFVTLMKATFPGFIDLELPMFLSYAHIALDGSIVCEWMNKAKIRRPVRVYDNEDAFIHDTRKLADGLKLPDKDRVEMFAVLQKWVASDRRVGAFGEKLAS